ncbi:potassium channel family protein [Geodermatophilus sp. SYSU D00758]
MDGEPVPGTGQAPRPAPAALRAHRRALVRAAVRTAGTATAVTAGYFLLPLASGFGAGTVLALLVGLVLVGPLVVWQVRAILRAPFPTLRGLEALALTVPLFLVLFAAVYVVLSGSRPDAFSEPLTRTDALYFAVTVFATVGFGDITPVSQVARVLVTVQMVADLVVLGFVVKVLVDAVQRSLGARRHGPAA